MCARLVTVVVVLVVAAVAEVVSVEFHMVPFE
jgi:hypothetical protein